MKLTVVQLASSWTPGQNNPGASTSMEGYGG